MELIQYWKVIQKSLWVVVLVVALGLASAILYTLNQPTVYESSATMLLNPQVPSQLVPYVQTQFAANLADSYTQLLHTRSFGESVSKELPFPLSAGKISESIASSLDANTLFFHISSQAATAEQAQQLLSAVLKVFLSANGAPQGVAGATADNGKTDVGKSLDDQLKSLQSRIDYYNLQISSLESQPPSQDRETQLFALQGRLDSLQKAKTDTLVAIAQVGENDQTLNSAIVVDQPLLGHQLPNNLLRNLGLAFSTALIIGVGLAFLRDYLDYTVHTPDELKGLLQLPVMSTLGLLGAATGRRRLYGRHRNHSSTAVSQAPEQLRGHNLVTLEHPKSPEAESFRILRTNIQFSGLSTPIKSLVVTSAGPRDGKSFVAANLAVVMSQAGKRVILVDCDLRKPTVHKTFSLPNTLGFTNLIMQEVSGSATALQLIPGLDNLAVLTSGPLPPNPSELLNSAAAIELMGQLQSHADVVIYDTPPAAAVTDPLILAARTDATVLVVNAGSTRRDVVVRVKEALEHVAARAILPVLNRARPADMRGYYYYQYYGYYGQDGPETGANKRKAHTNGQAPVEVVAVSAENGFSAKKDGGPLNLGDK